MFFKGTEYLQRLLKENHFTAKMVFNSEGALIFPVTQEHRDQKAPGISYEDNYKGNAMAAMLSPGKIEVRFHQHYRDAQVATIIRKLSSYPGIAAMQDWEVTYQGRSIN